MNNNSFGAMRLAGNWVIALGSVLSIASAMAAGDGTLVIFRNATNSVPRIISLWGGAETQTILKSDGTVWAWGFNG
jgi:alpha-tubulin suppressor-like RCC1 family protein